MSDHFVVHFTLATCRSPLPRKSIYVRGLKSINRLAFKEDIKNSFLSLPLSNDADELVKFYDQQLTKLLDKYAPVKLKNVTIRLLAPWYTDDILSLRKKVRCTERRWRRTGENKHLDEYRNHKNSLTNAIKTAKRAHYQSKISSAGQSQKALFNALMNLHEKAEQQLFL